MKLLEEKVSTDGIATKRIYERSSGVAEVAILRKPDKDILVLPTATGCALGCKFCPLTVEKVGPGEQLNKSELAELVFDSVPDTQREGVETLLLSFMGVGEPLLNQWIDFWFLRNEEYRWRTKYKHVRFAVASCIPSVESFHHLLDLSAAKDVKLHWSLHFTREEQREEYMPRALSHWAALPLFRDYAKKQRTEVHYTLIADVNDTREDCERLALMFAGADTTVKLLTFSEPTDGVLKASQFVGDFAKGLRVRGVRDVEIYDPPGRDICASCGMFETERYI